MQGSHRLPRGLATRMAVVFTFAFAALALAAAPAGAAFPGQNGAVYFTRANGDNTDIYAVRPDKSVVQITSSGTTSQPAVSPDGTQLAYHDSLGGVNPEENGQVFLAGPDGKNPRQLTTFANKLGQVTCCNSATDPSFSSEGDSVVFAAEGNDVNEIPEHAPSIWQIDLNPPPGAVPYSPITPVDINREGEGQRNPEYSPGDFEVAYADHFVNDGFPCTAHIETHPPNPFPPTTEIDCGLHPSWSPDGSRIAEEELGISGKPPGAICTVPSGGNHNNANCGPFEGSEPSYAPDGSKLVFVFAETDQSRQGLFTSSASDFSRLRRLTRPPAGFVDRNPYWSSATLPAGSCRGHEATLTGTAHGDTLAGAGARDVISAGHGVDKVGGRRGHDLLCAGRGHDVLRGGAGNDTLIDTRGRSHVDCGAGKHDVAITTRRSKVNDCEKVIRR
jgi:RTX calcium-binding nonapeptide repeat (4 copies)/WD40-like Beta Propeller Repeat